jgi:hypothetical protein
MCLTPTVSAALCYVCMGKLAATRKQERGLRQALSLDSRGRWKGQYSLTSEWVGKALFSDPCAGVLLVLAPLLPFCADEVTSWVLL